MKEGDFQAWEMQAHPSATPCTWERFGGEGLFSGRHKDRVFFIVPLP